MGQCVRVSLIHYYGMNIQAFQPSLQQANQNNCRKYRSRPNSDQAVAHTPENIEHIRLQSIGLSDLQYQLIDDLQDGAKLSDAKVWHEKKYSLNETMTYPMTLPARRAAHQMPGNISMVRHVMMLLGCPTHSTLLLQLAAACPYLFCSLHKHDEMEKEAGVLMLADVGA